eukprot:gene15270-16846_t
MVRTILCQPVSEPKVFTDEYDATSTCCTPDGLILISSSAGNIHVYFASEKNSGTRCSYKIGGVANKIVHCSHVGYIATLENKLNEYHSTLSHKSLVNQARVYVNWATQPSDARCLISLRAGYTQETQPLQSHPGKFVAIDLPIKYSATDIACCDATGNIAISTEAKVFLYSYQQLESPKCLDGDNSSGSLADFDLILEIDAGFQINQVALYESHIAFASFNELRAIQIYKDRKESICQAEDVSESINITHPSSSPPSCSSAETGISPHCELCQSKADEHFVMWNIDRGCSQGVEGLEQETIAVSKRTTTFNNTTATSNITPANTSTPTYVVKKSTVKFRSVADDSLYTDHSKTAKEVIGPKETIPGHPLIVVNSSMLPRLAAGQRLLGSDVNHVTTLYRRFADSQSLDAHSIHNLQWMPIRVQNSVGNKDIAADTSSLVALGFFFSTARKGYVYDILNTPSLLSEYDFTDDCLSACLTNEMLHVITKNGLETYTTRLYAAAAQAASKEGPGEVTSHQTQIEAVDRPLRTWSSLSFSSGSEADSKSQAGDSLKDFSEEDNPEASASDDMVLTEGHYTKVKAAEPRSGVAKKSKTKLSFGRRSKNSNGKRKENNRVEVEKCQESVSGMEKIASYLLTENRLKKSPSYAFCDLIQPCPPTNIDICLIGMYSLRGFTFIGSCDKHAVLLQKVYDHKAQRRSSGKERTLPWNIYILEKVPAIDVCKEIVSLIEGSEFANPNVFYQLLSESHLCLRSGLTSDIPEDRKELLRRSIQKSAVMLADFFARCRLDLNGSGAKKYYNMASIKLGNVLTRHAKRDEEENTGLRYGSSMISYLNDQIFNDNNDIVDSLTEENTVQILKIYSVAAPDLLSQIILKSKLKITCPENVVSIMETLHSQEIQKIGHYKLTNVDYIALAILKLQLGDLPQAEHLLKRIPNSELIEAILEHPGVLRDGESLSLLGQLLKRHFFATFIDLMILLHDRGLLTVDAALGLFGKAKEGEQSQKPRSKACGFLEELLNDQKRSENFPEIMNYLIDYYLAWLKQKPQVELLKIPHLHIPKGDGHFVARHDWLDKLPPFSGEKPVPQDCLLRKQRQISKSNQPTPENSPKVVSSSIKTDDITQKCTCCCCNSILIKLQSLLSSPLCSKSICEKVMHFCEENFFPGEDSLKLLCYPAIGKTSEAVNFVVEFYPSVMFHYARDVFRHNKEEWKSLLNCLLKTLRENLYEQWNKDTYMDALKGTLLKLARLCQPREFLELLPNEGTAGYFVPFIHECYQIHNSMSLRKKILKTYEPAVVVS